MHEQLQKSKWYSVYTHGKLLPVAFRSVVLCSSYCLLGATVTNADARFNSRQNTISSPGQQGQQPLDLALWWQRCLLLVWQARHRWEPWNLHWCHRQSHQRFAFSLCYLMCPEGFLQISSYNSLTLEADHFLRRDTRATRGQGRAASKEPPLRALGHEGSWAAGHWPAAGALLVLPSRLQVWGGWIQ